jgi:ferredoxin-thioredoxin reductase catalytic subunit/rubredoxin
MTAREAPSPERIEDVRERLHLDAEASGYHLNPDLEFARGLAEGLLVNEQRYGYRACPCRLARGDVDADRDIVCPCDYRDADLLEWGSCYCGLYVSDAIHQGKAAIVRVPERRPSAAERHPVPTRASVSLRGIHVWRCRVCGYLCARERPPAVCPICKATSDRFEAYSEPLRTSAAPDE